MLLSQCGKKQSNKMGKMNEQKGNVNTDECNLLSILCAKDYKLSKINADIVFAIRAFKYLEGKAGIKILNDDIKCRYEAEQDISFTELCQSIERYNPNSDSAEINLLKEEITNLCYYLATKKPSTSAHCLLEKCNKWRPFHFKGKKGEHGGGRNPKEDFFSEVFCFVFNHSPQLNKGVTNLINKKTGITLECEPIAISQDPQPAHLEVNNKGIRWDIEIKDLKNKSIVIENKIDAGLGYKEIIEYPKCYMNCGHSSYILLSCNRNEVIKDLNIGVNHISWFDGDDSILNILNQCATEYEYEKIYLKYFIELINSTAITISKTMTIREIKDELNRINLLDKFNIITEGLGDAYKALPGKKGFIFYLEKDGHAFFPFRINKTGNFDIQWKGKILNQSDLKAEFIDRLKKSSIEIPDDKQSFNIRTLSFPDIAAIRSTLEWLAKEIEIKD